MNLLDFFKVLRKEIEGWVIKEGKSDFEGF